MNAVRSLLSLTTLLLLASLTACMRPPDKPSISLYLALQRGDIDQLERHIAWDADVNEVFADGTRPLHVAASHNRIVMTRMLLKNGADPNGQDAAGQTPLTVAVLGGRTQVAEVLTSRGAALDPDQLLLEAARRGVSDRDVVRFLAEKGADLEATTDTGDTALLIAVRQGHRVFAKHLLALGADVNHRDAEGRTPLAIAESLGEQAIAGLLQRQGAQRE